MLKVIAKLGDIPVGSTVTKIGGSVEYIVKAKLTVYNEAVGTNTDLFAGEGCLFLVGTAGAINAFGLEKELIWHTTLSKLNALAYEAEERVAQ